jgi:glycosyltransferase involved in cell wall biosynthesis
MLTRAARPGRLRVLFLTFEFPPLASGGVFRAAGWARTLPAQGVDLSVVTVRESDHRSWSSAPQDASLAADIPSAVAVHRIPSGFPAWYWRLVRSRAGARVAQYAYWGDPVAVFWRRPLMDTLDRLIGSDRPDVLLATVPPFGVGVLAAEVARRHRLPWVADFRDAWLRWTVAPYPSFAHYAYTRHREEAILRGANVSVATSHVTRDQWMTDHPGVAAERLVTVYNAYDEGAEAPGAPSENDHREGGDGGVRHIVYAGNFYYTPAARAAMVRPWWRRRPDQWPQYRSRREDWLYRSPYFFLRGLRRFADRYPELRDRLRVTFAGPVPQWLPVMLADTRTADLVTLAGPLSRAAVWRLEHEADALLLTSARVEGGRDCSIAGKTYEYFAARRPILALLADGAMRDLVTESGLGLFADADDADAVAAAIHRVVAASNVCALVSPDETFIGRFAREAVAAQLAEQLRRAADEGYRG